jgi:hypothetical protein
MIFQLRDVISPLISCLLGLISCVPRLFHMRVISHPPSLPRHRPKKCRGERGGKRMHGSSGEVRAELGKVLVRKWR